MQAQAMLQSAKAVSQSCVWGGVCATQPRFSMQATRTTCAARTARVPGAAWCQGHLAAHVGALHCQPTVLLDLVGPRLLAAPCEWAGQLATCGLGAC
jgi:hypothetical protein